MPLPQFVSIGLPTILRACQKFYLLYGLVYHKERQREAKPQLFLYGEFKRGGSPSFYFFPLMQGIHIHIMERGIKGVR